MSDRPDSLIVDGGEEDSSSLSEGPSSGSGACLVLCRSQSA